VGSRVLVVGAFSVLLDPAELGDAKTRIVSRLILAGAEIRTRRWWVYAEVNILDVLNVTSTAISPKFSLDVISIALCLDEKIRSTSASPARPINRCLNTCSRACTPASHLDTCRTLASIFSANSSFWPRLFQSAAAGGIEFLWVSSASQPVPSLPGQRSASGTLHIQSPLPCGGDDSSSSAEFSRRSRVVSAL